MTQCEMLIEYMQTGKGITQLEALNRFGIGRLASRICDLKAGGYEIVARSKTIVKANGKKTVVCEYFLKEGICTK